MTGLPAQALHWRTAATDFNVNAAFYGSLFREYSTAVISPELLAALAQVEGAETPVASTYWRWQLSWNPLALYQPASSAVGMFQMTDAAQAMHPDAGPEPGFRLKEHVSLLEGTGFELPVRGRGQLVPGLSVALPAVGTVWGWDFGIR